MLPDHKLRIIFPPSTFIEPMQLKHRHQISENVHVLLSDTVYPSNVAVKISKEPLHTIREHGYVLLYKIHNMVSQW